jgi:hypothetical protein
MCLLLRLSSLPVDMRHHDSFLQEPGDGTRKERKKETSITIPFEGTADY